MGMPGGKRGVDRGVQIENRGVSLLGSSHFVSNLEIMWPVVGRHSCRHPIFVALKGDPLAQDFLLDGNTAGASRHEDDMTRLSA
jgi:hypothetical protein